MAGGFEASVELTEGTQRAVDHAEVVVLLLTEGTQTEAVTK